MQSEKKVQISIQRSLNQVLLRDIYYSPVVTLHEESPFHLVEENFTVHRIKHLPVVNTAKKLVGLITMADLLRIVPPRKNLATENFEYNRTDLDAFNLKEQMTTNPISLQPLQSLLDAMEMMVKEGHGCVPVVDEHNKILGIVTQTDIVNISTKIIEESIEYVSLVEKVPLRMIMSYPPIVLKDDDELSKVEHTLRASRIKHLPIVNILGRLSGIITLSDLYRTESVRHKDKDGRVKLEKASLDRHVLKYWMTKDPFTLTAEDNLLMAMRQMVKGKYGCVLIINEDKMIRGIITQTDVIKSIIKLIHS